MCVVDSVSLSIHKVPFSFRQVPGSFTGEVLCDELIQIISNVKKVEGNAFDKIESMIIKQRRNQVS